MQRPYTCYFQCTASDIKLAKLLPELIARDNAYVRAAQDQVFECDQAGGTSTHSAMVFFGYLQPHNGNTLTYSSASNALQATSEAPKYSGRNCSLSRVCGEAHSVLARTESRRGAQSCPALGLSGTEYCFVSCDFTGLSCHPDT